MGVAISNTIGEVPSIHVQDIMQQPIIFKVFTKITKKVT